MDLLAHPFRVTPGRAIATVEDDTDDATAQAIAVLVLTRKGERDLVPGYGITDPTFGTVALAEVNTGLTDYGPPGVTVDAVTSTYPTSTTERVTLTFTTQQE